MGLFAMAMGKAENCKLSGGHHFNADYKTNEQLRKGNP
jgi:type IV secretory pathway VirJ component